MIKTTGVHAYQQQVVRGAEAAKPEELVALLFTRLLETLAKARHFIAVKNFAKKTDNLNFAIDILNVLEESLDYDQGGELAENLQGLYQYSAKKLLDANVSNDTAMVDEVMSLMSEIQEGWKSVLTGGQP